VHPRLKRSATSRRVNCDGMRSASTTSSDAPVSDWLRMKQAIVRPLNSMLPDFKALHSNSALPRQVTASRTHCRSTSQQSVARSAPQKCVTPNRTLATCARLNLLLSPRASLLPAGLLNRRGIGWIVTATERIDASAFLRGLPDDRISTRCVTRPACRHSPRTGTISKSALLSLVSAEGLEPSTP